MEFICIHIQVKINPLAFAKDDIDIKDIAHALSCIVSYGHLKCFILYNIVLISSRSISSISGFSSITIASILWCQWSFISDIIRPLKQHLKLYEDIKSMDESCLKVWTFRIKGRRPLKIKRIDDDIRSYELYWWSSNQSRLTIY